MSTPPPPSCSPLSGLSSSNVNTETFAGGNGVSCNSTLTAACAGPIPIGAPPMPWQQVPVTGAKSAPLGPDGQSRAMLNGRLAVFGSLGLIGTGAPAPALKG